MPFPQTKKFFNNKSFINSPQKPPFYKSKTFACRPKTPTFFTNKSFPFTQAFPYRHPKQPFFALHLPFPPSHNLLFAKNTAILLSSALNPYAVTPERRTDSKPFRRRFARKTGFGSCRRNLLQKYFRQSFESLPGSPEGRNPRRVFAVLFARRKKYQPVLPYRELRGFPNLDSAHRNGGFAQTQLKPSKKEIRGSANLETAHPNKTSHNAN